MPKHALFAFASALSLLAVACSSSAPDASQDTTDLSASSDLGTHPDLSAPSSAVCALPYDQRLIDSVSSGTVTVTPDGTGFTADIDATAGGPADALNNPYVYVDLIAGKKVEISDVQAQKSADWDIAFKRWQIKINSGDSGPGGVKAATVPATDLPQVTTAPTSGYSEDDYFDAACKFNLDANGGPETVLASWYGYDINTHVLTPQKQVYVLNRRDGKGAIKLQITSYYKAGAGGNFTIRWAMLP